MKANIQHKNKSGIYCIRNLINNKVYIGKSIDIHRRIKRHIGALNMKSKKHENDYLINAWNKYGRSNFEYFVLEFVDINEKLLSERELYWITQYDALNHDKGYNLRLDVNSVCVVSKETRNKCSESGKLRFSKPEEREKISKFFKNFWKENPEKLDSMKAKIKITNHKFKILQYDKQMNFVKVWDSVNDIIENNPNYKWQNIYSVCNGYKPSMYGYIWKKESKI